ncbi:hypothetical protein [Acidianus sp. HS-5]|uniref:hypothetical protein n=1 Tax=Acidianus sp. HS-5 TaxID=2886040 RepID=UPI001F24E679|nr:hypothetical protein [Acidianus sp. HS-5]
MVLRGDYRQIATNKLPYIITLIFTFIVVNNWFRGKVIFGGDMSFIIYPGVNSNYYLSMIINAFNLNAQALGSYGANPQLFWYYGLIYIFSLIHSIFSEEIMIFLLLSLGSIYVYRLVYEIVLDNLKIKKINAITAGLISATFFVSNWGLVEAYAYNIILTIAFVYPLLPVLTYYVRALLVKSSGMYIVKNLILISILGTIIISTVNIIYFLQIAGFMIFIFLFYSISRNLRKFIKNILLSVSSFILIILGNYYWIAPTTKAASIMVSNKGLDALSLYYFKSNSLCMPFSLVIRDLGFNGHFNYPEYSLILSFIIPILTFIPFLMFRNIRENKETIIYVIITFIAITFWAGITTPFSSIYLYLFEHFPYFIEFRTENVAFAWLASFLFSITVGLGYASIATRLKKKSIVIGFVLLIILSVIIPYPVFSGDLNSRVNVPNYFIGSVNFINSLNNSGEVLILPKSPNWFFSTWYVGTNIWQYFSIKPVIYGGVYSSSELSIRQLYDNISNILTLNNYTSTNILELKNIFILLNIKYIVVENDSTTTPYTTVDKYVQNLFLLQKYDIVSFLHKFDKIYIFKTEVNSSYFYLFSSKYYRYIVNITLKNMENINYSRILLPINNYTVYHDGKFILNLNDNKGYLFVIFNYMNLWNINNTYPEESYIYNNTFGNIFPVNLSGIITLKNELQASANVELMELMSYLISALVILFLIEIFIKFKFIKLPKIF